MAAIREYTNPIDQIRPNDKGVGAMADLAASQGRTGYYIAQQIKDTGRDFAGAISDAGRATAEWYDQNRTKMEISQGNTLLTNKEMEYTKKWQELTSKSDPNDASIGPKFMEEITADLEKSVNGATSYGGREWMKKQAEQMMLGWFKQTQADSATRAGQAIRDNAVKSVNTAGAVISANPTSLDRMLEQQTDALKKALENSPNLNAATRAQLGETLTRQVRGELVQRGLQTMMDANPEAGLAVLKSGKYSADITPDGYKALENYAAAVTKRKETEGKAEIERQKQIRSEAFSQAASKVYDTQVAITPDGNVTVKPGFFKAAQDLMRVDPSKTSEVRSMITWGNAQIDRATRGLKATDDPATFEDFRSRIFLGPDEPNGLKMAEVYQAAARGELSDKSFSFFKDAVQKDYKDPAKSADYREFERVMKHMRPSFVRGSLFGADDGGVGERNFMRFRQEKWAEYRAGRDMKVPASELLSAMGPKSIIKDFNRYILSAEQQMQLQADRMRGVAGQLPAVKPAENMSPSQFDQRFFGSEQPRAKWDGKMSMDDLFKQLQGGK